MTDKEEDCTPKFDLIRYLWSQGSMDDLVLFFLMFAVLVIIYFVVPDIAEFATGSVFGAAAVYLKGGKNGGDE